MERETQSTEPWALGSAVRLAMENISVHDIPVWVWEKAWSSGYDEELAWDKQFSVTQYA